MGAPWRFGGHVPDVELTLQSSVRLARKVAGRSVVEPIIGQTRREIRKPLHGAAGGARRHPHFTARLERRLEASSVYRVSLRQLLRHGSLCIALPVLRTALRTVGEWPGKENTKCRGPVQRASQDEISSMAIPDKQL